MINEPEWSGTLVLRWRLGDNLSDKWFILSNESSEWTVHFYGSDVSFKVIIILISCTYVTINSSFSMPKMRSQQTQVHATNIMHNFHYWLSVDWYIGRLSNNSFQFIFLRVPCDHASILADKLSVAWFCSEPTRKKWCMLWTSKVLYLSVAYIDQGWKLNHLTSAIHCSLGVSSNYSLLFLWSCWLFIFTIHNRLRVLFFSLFHWHDCVIHYSWFSKPTY